MSLYKFIETKDITFPNMTVYRKMTNGEHIAWRVEANDGYVIYDTSANATEIDEATGQEKPVIYYCARVGCPLNIDWDKFTWVAVPVSDVDKKYII